MERRKKVLMNKIFHLSNELNETNNEGFLKPLEDAQNEISQINQRIPEIIEELETLPSDINKQNAILLRKP